MTIATTKEQDAPVQHTFPTWPCFAADELAAVARLLALGKVNYWTGDEGRKFEQEFAGVTGCRHAVTRANGTAVLELALYALGIGQCDKVVTASRTFISSANCTAMRGARPVIGDVDRASRDITADTVRAVLSPHPCHRRWVIAMVVSMFAVVSFCSTHSASSPLFRREWRYYQRDGCSQSMQPSFQDVTMRSVSTSMSTGFR